MWEIYESLSNADKKNLKKAILDWLDPDTDKHHLAAQDQLSQRRLCLGVESIDKLARDLKKLLDQGLASDMLEAEWCFLNCCCVF